MKRGEERGKEGREARGKRRREGTGGRKGERNLIFLLLLHGTHPCTRERRRLGREWKRKKGGEERGERRKREWKKEREREKERKKERYNFIQYNLIIGIISFNKIHDMNALHKYSHVNKGILNRNFI